MGITGNNFLKNQLKFIDFYAVQPPNPKALPYT
jgi:hypothetical protein